jgi:hypothetical protein
MGGAQAGEAPKGDGRIPLTFRIGVTGHRELADPQAVRAAVREAIRLLKLFLPISAEQGLVLTVVSALAEGADRLVAEEVLAEEGARLEVALPMATDEYLNDFKQESSKQEFKGLMDRASRIWQAPASADPEHGYDLAGRYVVDHSDAVIAIWDGKPPRGNGGTAHIVQYARHRKITLVIVWVEGRPSVEFAQKPPAVLPDVARQMARYNSRRMKAGRFDQQLSELREQLMPDMPSAMSADPLGLSRQLVAEWLFPYFARVEVLARRRQKIFKLCSVLIFGLAAASVVAVAVGSNFPHARYLPHGWKSAALEIVFLIGLLGIFLGGRYKHLHDQWISYRFLAERLRSTYFLTLAGANEPESTPTRRMTTTNPSEAWVERALLEVTDVRPARPADLAPSVVTLRGYLSQYWIESQRHYLVKTSHGQHRIEGALTCTTVVLFALTILVAISHFIFHNIESLIVTLSLSVPAIGAAVHGINSQRQYGRHAERYRRVAEQLQLVNEAMESADSPERIRRYAAKTERILLHENSDWFGVMRFLDMELIT